MNLIAKIEQNVMSHAMPPKRRGLIQTERKRRFLAVFYLGARCEVE